MVSTPKYHPLFSFSPIKGEKILQGSYISDSCCRPFLHSDCREGWQALILQKAAGQNCLKLCFQELLSPPAGGRGKKVRGNLFFSLPALILRELVGQEFHFNKSYESFYKIKPGSHWTSPRIKNAIQIRIIVMSLKK